MRAVVGRVQVLALALGALTGCDSFVDPFDPVDRTGGGALADPATAELQVRSAVALFECGYSTFGWVALGHEDVMQSIAGLAASAHVYRSDAVPGECDQSRPDQSWFDAMMGARAMITNARGTGVYDRLRDEWADAPLANRARLSAMAAIYAAAVYQHFGDYYCEAAFDAGPLMTPEQVLAEAELWSDRALGHIGEAGSDFAMPYGVSESALTMARALRARIRWASGDVAGALADAATIPQGFTAWVTRDQGEARRNKLHAAVFYSGMLGVNDWWNPAIRRPNPVTGQPWPDPIPFTGYLFLGVLPDGRAVDESGLPVRWAEERRDLSGDPVPLGNGALPDTRVQHRVLYVSGPEPREIPSKYMSDADDIPLVDWKEMWLIRAEIEGGQTAIDLVNDLRTAAGLPQVSYITGATATPQQIRYMITEERRREFYTEGGRYWATKIRNPDLLWFPRREGRTPFQGYALEGGVRLVMPPLEYNANPNLSLQAMGTGCHPNEAPVL